jgi:hypothetical protein
MPGASAPASTVACPPDPASELDTVEGAAKELSVSGPTISRWLRGAAPRRADHAGRALAHPAHRRVPPALRARVPDGFPPPAKAARDSAWRARGDPGHLGSPQGLSDSGFRRRGWTILTSDAREEGSVKETGRFLGLGRLAAPLADDDVRRAGGLARAAAIHRGAALGARCPRAFPGALGNRNGDEDSQAHDRRPTGDRCEQRRRGAGGAAHRAGATAGRRARTGDA